MFEELFPENLYHSYVIEGNPEEVVYLLRVYLEERGDINKNSPDVMLNLYDAFNIEDVALEIKEKLIRRHPHVFADVEVNSTQDILNNWEQIKQEEKSHRTSIMDGISRSQSALMSAQKISKKAVKVGFEWDCEKTLYDCVFSEIEEFQEACKTSNSEHIEEEMGDILFSIVNLARWNKLDAEQTLLKANKKFIKRFKQMEKLATKPLEEYSFKEFDELWNQAKNFILQGV